MSGMGTIEATTAPKREATPARRRPFATGRLENFAREQIRGLVRQVFFAGGQHPVRQVVFAAVDGGTDIGNICELVGETLARETAGSVAVAARHPQQLPTADAHEPWRETATRRALRKRATQAKENLWLIASEDANGNPVTAQALHASLREMRTEFEYSIVEALPAGESHEATAMGQFADGIILVLSAQTTRRATARKIKEDLEATQVRILGTVLSDRQFPVPEAIYRRL